MTDRNAAQGHPRLGALPAQSLEHLAVLGKQWGFTPGDVRVIALEARTALTRYGTVEAAKAAVRERYVTGRIRTVDGEPMYTATGAEPRNVTRLVAQVCRLLQAEQPQPPREAPAAIEVDPTAGPAMAESARHTETWCPTARASVLLGPDRRCPGCHDTIPRQPRRRWRRRSDRA